MTCVGLVGESLPRDPRVGAVGVLLLMGSPFAAAFLAHRLQGRAPGPGWAATGAGLFAGIAIGLLACAALQARGLPSILSATFLTGALGATAGASLVRAATTEH
jgi:hypothetical protein